MKRFRDVKINQVEGIKWKVEGGIWLLTRLLLYSLLPST